MKRLNRHSVVGLLMLAAFSTPLFTYEKTGIDYDTSVGTKPLEPLYDYGSKLGFIPDADGVKKHFSQFEVEEQRSAGKIMILRLTHNKATQHEFVDFDLSGKFESWKKYQVGYVAAEMRLDEEKAILVEKTMFDEQGNILEVLRDGEKKGFLSERSVYKSGKIVKTNKDKDGDGLFEEEIVYFTDDKPYEYSEIIPPVTVPTGKPVYVAGLYKHGEIITLETKLTEKLFKYLNTANKFDDVNGYQKIIFPEGKNDTKLVRKYPNRFEIYKAIALKKGKKSSELPKMYVISGDVFESSGRISIYFRLLGPTPIDNVTSGAIHLASTDFTTDSAAKQIADHVAASIPQ